MGESKLVKELHFLDIKEFIDEGYLHEVNRQFFHPLGLALEVNQVKGKYILSGIWDCRDDEEGILFYSPDKAKIEKIRQQWYDRYPARVKKRGFWIQPETHSLPRPTHVPLLEED